MSITYSPAPALTTSVTVPWGRRGGAYKGQPEQPITAQRCQKVTW